MKKLLFLMAVMITFASCVNAEEVKVEEAVQNTDVDASGVVCIFNKQPGDAKITQTVKVRRSGFVFIFNINGKVQVEDDTDRK